MKRKVGVVLSGCGFLDGAEISEAVLTLLALDEHDMEAVCAAPAGLSVEVVDHVTRKPVAGERRGVLAESARIARGHIRPLGELSAAALDAVVLPGGFGAAKHLCDFATRGGEATPHPEVARLLRDMHAQQKPIGAACIAPSVVAAALGRTAHPLLTIGRDPGTAAALAALGARHQDAPVDACVVDAANRIVSTPAYMYDARVRDVAKGIRAMVAALAEMMGTKVVEAAR